MGSLGKSHLVSSNESADAATPEESGWTTYLQDYSLYCQTEKSSKLYGYNDDDDENPSLVSDAASHAAWGSAAKAHQIQVNDYSAIDGPHQFPMRRLKTPRTKKFYEDDLEDTASSPVNSPKVSSLKQMDTRNKKSHESVRNFLGKGCSSGHHHLDEKSQDLIDLKKRGLCLMPMSMLVNYFG